MSTKRIKGLTIEIDGDTKGLQKSIAAIDKSLKTTESELKDVTKLLKLDPTNTELLRQKQQLLQEATAKTKERMSQLTKAMEEAQKAGSKIDSKSFDALQREIIETQQNLDRLEAESTSAGKTMKKSFADAGKSIDALGTKLQTAGEKTTEIGKTLTGAITAPLAGAAAGAVKTYSDVADALDIITVKTGASGEALEAMKKQAEDIATDIPTSFEQAAVAIGEVNTRFGVTGSQLSDIAKAFIKFSDLNDLDINTTIDKAQKAIAGFGLSVSDTVLFLDSLNKTGQKTGVSLDRLLDQAISSGAQFRELGLGAAETIDLLGKIEVSGTDTSKVLTALQRAMSYAAKNGTTLSSVLDSFYSSMSSGASDAEKLAYAVELFGTKSGPAMYDAAKAGSVAFDGLASSLADAAGSVNDTYEATLHGTDNIKMAANAVKLLASEIGNLLSEMLGPYLEKATEKIKQLRDAWQGLDDTEKQKIIKTLGAIALLGPGLAIAGKAISGVGAAVKMIGGLGGGAAASGAGLAAIAGPAAIATAAILGVVAAFTYFWKTSEHFRTTIKTIVEELKEKIQHVKELFTNAFGDIDIPELLDNIKVAFENFMAWFEPIFTGMFEVVGSVIGSVIDVIGGLVSFIIALANGDWESAWESLKTAVFGVLEGIQALLFKLPSIIFDALKDVVVFLATKAVPFLLEKLLMMIGTLFMMIFSKIADGLKALVSFLGDKLTGIGEWIKEKVMTILKFFKDLPVLALEWGRDFIQGLIDGITGKLTDFKNKIGDVAGAIREKLHFSKPDNGPLKDYETWMPDMINGLSKSLKKASPTLLDSLPTVQSQNAAMNNNTTNNNSYTVTINAQNGQSADDLFRVFDRKLGNLAKRKRGMMYV